MMRTWILSAALSLVSGSALAADVGVSVSVNQPGLYGRIDIGNVPQPQLIFPQPVVIQPVQIVRAPLYMHVPPGHAKNWAKHCSKYQACSRPVYFVREDWYNNVYVPHKSAKHKHKHKSGRDHDHGPKGHGKGHGHGHGKNH